MSDPSGQIEAFAAGSSDANAVQTHAANAVRARLGRAVGAHQADCHLRSATMADARLLLDWRNDPESRANSHRHDAVVWHAHLDWLADVLCDPRHELLIAELDGRAVGTVRLDRNKGDTTLSWTVAPEHRGKGLGTAMVRLAVNRVPHQRLSAEIVVGNERSVAIARAAGFQHSHTVGDVAVWHRPKQTGSLRVAEPAVHSSD